MRRSSLAALLLAALALPAAAAVPPARAADLFPVLAADPRGARLGVSYYRLEGRDFADLALGHAWGLESGRFAEDQSWQWALDAEALAVSRLRVFSGAGELEAADLSAALPFVARRGDAAFRFAAFHRSSHLGDDYIRRTGDAGRRWSEQGAEALFSLDPAEPLRVYGGAEALLFAVPATGRWALRGGFELTSPELRTAKAPPLRLFLAEELRWRQRVRWNMDSRLAAGAKFVFRDAPGRAVRAGLAWAEGHSPYGQFEARRERRLELFASLEL